MQEKKEDHQSKEPKKITVEFAPATLWKAMAVILGVLFMISLFTGGFGFAKNDERAQQIVPTTAPSAPIIAGQPQQPRAKASLEADDLDFCVGEKDAKVTIFEFSDYQCPFCQRAFQQTFPEIKKLVDEGKVKYCIKDYPLPFHEQADEAAVAANCAGEQGKYWEMHDKLFNTQGSWTGNTAVASVFTGYAKELGLDEKKFASCVNDPRIAKEVQDDIAEGSTAGVSGTPSFYINGRQLVGAQPWAAFKAIIDAELAA